MPKYAIRTLLACLLLCGSYGCSDDAVYGAPWSVRETSDARSTDDSRVDDASDVSDASEFSYTAVPLATAFDRMVFSAEHKSLGYCIELRLVSPANLDQLDDIERPEGWGIERLTASGSGCSPDPWPPGEGLEADAASGVISLDQTDGPYNGTISVTLSLRFPENDAGIPTRVDFASGDVSFECCR